MYVKNLQEYLDEFTNGKKGNAISNASIYMETDDGRLAPIIGQPSIRLVIKAEKRRAIISPTFNQT